METLEEDIKRCVTFHGHLCPGLALGIVAARAGLEELGVSRAEDEEVVSILETDACCADAIQVLTGSTFGKGNFIYRDVGKMAFTFISREQKKSIRLCLKTGVMELSHSHRALLDKMAEESATEAEIAEFWTHHAKKAEEILVTPWSALFSINATMPSMPPKARMEPSLPCDQCGEPVMASRLQEIRGKSLCYTCRGA